MEMGPANSLQTFYTRYTLSITVHKMQDLIKNVNIF